MCKYTFIKCIRALRDETNLFSRFRLKSFTDLTTEIVRNMTTTSQLPDDQQELLTQLEAEFADRYTENDPDYAAILQTSPTPPVVHPWYNRPRRQHDWTDRGRQRHNYDDRYRHNDRHNREDRQSRDDRYRRDDRPQYDDRPKNRFHPYHRYR